MELNGLHILLTYQCNYECDHCFVWGSPWQSGVFTLPQIRQALQQAQATSSIQQIYFEGGEPFLYYPILVQGVQLAVKMGFQVGIVTNAYWATSKEDAHEWLRPLAGLVEDLSVSSDLYHSDQAVSPQSQHALAAAEHLGIPVGVISIAPVCQPERPGTVGQLPIGESEVMFRGRAAEKLAPQAAKHPWRQFDRCPHEDLANPGRVHLDPNGNLHICQGISIGNIYQVELRDICRRYSPSEHPLLQALMDGGPVALVEHYRLAHQEAYADACHLCYEARLALRPRFPETLTPDQMYGVIR